MVGLIAVALGVLLDQGVKYWASTALKPMRTMPLWPDVFHLTYVENEGAAFSLLKDHRWVFITVSIVVTLVLIGLLIGRKVKHPLLKWSFYCIIAGGVGNLIDRIACGYVVDLFDFRLINFAVFNVADILITVGTVLLCVYVVFYEKFHPGASEPRPADGGAGEVPEETLPGAQEGARGEKGEGPDGDKTDRP